MFQDIVDDLQFFPLVFNFDMYGTLVARINSIFRGLPVFHFLIFLYMQSLKNVVVLSYHSRSLLITDQRFTTTICTKIFSYLCVCTKQRFHESGELKLNFNRRLKEGYFTICTE
jgi:hypothetical protein